MADIAFPSSGDPEEDAREAERLRLTFGRTAEGMCPNGCGPLTWPEYDNVAECPACKFVGVQSWGRGDFTKPGAPVPSKDSDRE